MSDYHTNFISLGSFSKLLAPSLRVGWIYINSTHENISNESSVIDDLSNSAVFDSSGGINVLGSMIVHHAIDTGFLNSYLDDSLNLLKKRCTTIINKLKNQKVFEFDIPNGGYFLWLKSNLNTKSVLDTVLDYKVKYHNGSKFSSFNHMENYLRLSFSYYDCDDLETGISRLIKCFKDYKKIKVAIMGSKGKLGSTIVKLLNELPYSDKFMIVSFIERNSLSSDSFVDNLRNTDIIIDVSSSEGTIQLINYLNSKNLKDTYFIRYNWTFFRKPSINEKLW